MKGVGDAVRSLCAALRAFDPADVSGRDCAALVAELATAEKACAAVRARAAVRAAECGAHGGQGLADASDWLARATGSTRAEARAELETAVAVESCPATRQALAAGELSLGQAGEIAKTEHQQPGSEDELLAVAHRESFATLKDVARRVRLNAMDIDELHRRQHGDRAFRHWRDAMGMVCFTGALEPEVGIPFVNRLDTETDRVFRAAHREGRNESRDAYAADAFVGMLSGGGTASSTKADVVIVIDINAYRRDTVAEGETCHIVDGGPIPVYIAKEMAKDAFVKAVIHDGVNVHTVKHFGRHIPVELRTALDLGPPPDFDGPRCRRCHNRFRIQWDHRNPFTNGGPTALANLDGLCGAPCHRDKTDSDRKAGLLRGKAPP
jgi:hypothetical protein